jgi:hypothetical protein
MLSDGFIPVADTNETRFAWQAILSNHASGPELWLLVPEWLREDPEMVQWAIRWNPLVFRFLSEEFRNSSYWARQALDGSGQVYKWIPDALRESQPGMAMRAVQWDWRYIKWVPEALRTPGVCLEALKGDWSAIYWCPEAFLDDPQWMRSAIRIQPRLIAAASERLRADRELALFAIRQDAEALSYTAFDRDPEMILTALSIASSAWFSIPKDLQPLYERDSHVASLLLGRLRNGK